MTRLIGMDEAGYGPNLGPLVVGLTDWQCDEPTTDSDLWDALSDSVTWAIPKTCTPRHAASETWRPQCWPRCM